MAKLKTNGLGRRTFGNKPYGNGSVFRFPVATGATGVLANSVNATAPIAVNDEISAGLLQAGFVADTVKIVVSTAFGVGVKASVGFAYYDGVDDASLPQAADYFGAGIDLAAVGDIAVPLKKKLQSLPKDAVLTVTITGAGVAQAAYADVVLKGELLGRG